MFIRAACICLSLVCLATAAHAQLDVRMENYLLRSAMGDNAELGSATPPQYLQPYLKQDESDKSLSLAMFSARFLGLESYEVGRPTLALEGAAQGATLGMFVGAVGTTLGAFDEKTAWYVTGAMAAIGALMGNARANDPSNRVRWRWNAGVDDHWATQDGPRQIDGR